MILKASQRSGAKQLATHLLKTEENEHVEVHELRGFMADNLQGALKEIQAVSQGTRCKQFMFSLSLNPPQTENVPIKHFENALADIEKELGLEGQPRVVLFHEKEGRRHAHCVWSRIDTEVMKAINLPHYKYKLRDISKQLYLKHGWQMPRGLIDSKKRDPRNFTLAEWQQAKRMNEDPKTIKSLFQECWAVSDSGKAFTQALKERGFYLARGDRRGFVAVDYRGEVFSLSRWVGVKAKELKNRLGDPKKLPGITQVKDEIAKNMTQILEIHIKEVHQKIEKKKEPLLKTKQAMRDHHRKYRASLKEKQKERWNQETIERSKRLPRGLKAIWFRVTGKYQKIRRQNERKTEQCRVRDRREMQSLIERQLKERQKLQTQIRYGFKEYNNELFELKQDISRYIGMAEKVSVHEKSRNIGYEFENNNEHDR